ncbi:MAG: efflux RND transporter periplasmic adaptor subunit [Anaerolineales bacterium]|nr:efflux RND transporter periplasmic adaptor subunit [Anaerolineales bacterium]
MDDKKHIPNRKMIIIPLLVILALAATAAVVWAQRNHNSNEPLTASGTVEAVEILVSPELSGRVADVLVNQGDLVQAGDPLIRLDDELLQSQRQRAVSALEAARSGLVTAQAGLEIAQASLRLAQISIEASQVQYDITLNAARQADLAARTKAWKDKIPSEFDQPVWYFNQAEEISAAQVEVQAASDVLTAEQANYETVVQKVTNDDLKAAEERLSRARTAFLVAEDVYDRAKGQSNQEMRDYAESLYDAAEADLEAAQKDYDKMLSETASDEVLEARARLAVAQERYDTALDHLNSLLTGNDSLQVRAARIGLQQAQANAEQTQIGVKQAQAKLDQAEKAVAQAQAELDLMDVQIKKLTVYASTSGVILSRDVEPGEVIQAGASVLSIGLLDQMTITVYLPEDQYGKIKLGEQARVTVDSFPGQSFIAAVTHIADRAEFTPRNVQTAEGRRTTVFAIKLAISEEASASGKLKPGMPADVRFSEP